MLQLQDLRCQSLTKGKDSTTTKLIEVHLFTHILAYLIVWFYLASLSQSDFLVLVLDFAISHNHTVTIDLEVTLVRVHNDIKVLIATKNLGKHITEAFLQHAHQSSTVDILGFLKLAECINHTRCYFLLFLSHILFETY